MSKKDGYLFLKSLKEDGIDQIYRDPSKRKKSTPQSASAAQAAPSKKAAQKPAPASGDRENAFEILHKKVSKCTLCYELATTRQNVVFGSGDINAKLMFVGEAPGADEDEQGLPFVGRAGQLLTKIIESIGFNRESVYIANTLKCRPPQNRPPQPQEKENCRPFLDQQIALIKPKIICALGTHGAQTVLKTETPISQLREIIHVYPGNPDVKVICTFHPAYLLRNPAEKRRVWEDMKWIKRELEQMEDHE